MTEVDVDPVLVEEMLALIEQSNVSNNDRSAPSSAEVVRARTRMHGSLVYLNAEGKASSDEQIGAIIESVNRHTSSRWVCIVISEADWTNSMDDKEDEIDGHLVLRHAIVDGRAQKVIIHRSHRFAFRDVSWYGRAGRLDYHFSDGTSHLGLCVVFGHLAHGDVWEESYEDLLHVHQLAPKSNSVYVCADFNVEFRRNFQSRSDRDRADLIYSGFDGARLIPMCDICDQLTTRRPSGLSALLESPSCIDMGFVPRNAQSNGSVVWDEAPGDHAFLKIEIYEALPRPYRAPFHGKWRCADLEGYINEVNAQAPEEFQSFTGLVSFLRPIMDRFTDPRTSKQRRRDWEPARLKDLRRQLRIATSEVEQNHLRRKFVQLRVQISKTRKALKPAQELKEGKYYPKKISKLFPLTQVCIDGSACSDPAEWAKAGSQEFLRRWKQTSQTDIDEFSHLLGDGYGFVSVSTDEMAIGLSTCGKPWRYDLHGLCIRALQAPVSLLTPLWVRRATHGQWWKQNVYLAASYLVQVINERIRRKS